MKDLVLAAQEIAYSEQKQTGMPLEQHIDLSRRVGKKLAESLHANQDIVEIGCLMMDCMIGKAIQENRIGDHVDMSLKRTEEWLQTTSVPLEIRENILSCVREHHGVSTFHSLESEICCNADCYRFASVEGFCYALRFMRDMPFEELINLLKGKASEKWDALTLPVCKKELEDQHIVITQFLEYANSESISDK